MVARPPQHTPPLQTSDRITRPRRDISEAGGFGAHFDRFGATGKRTENVSETEKVSEMPRREQTKQTNSKSTVKSGVPSPRPLQPKPELKPKPEPVSKPKPEPVSKPVSKPVSVPGDDSDLPSPQIAVAMDGMDVGRFGRSASMPSDPSPQKNDAKNWEKNLPSPQKTHDIDGMGVHHFDHYAAGFDAQELKELTAGAVAMWTGNVEPRSFLPFEIFDVRVGVDDVSDARWAGEKLKEKKLFSSGAKEEENNAEKEANARAWLFFDRAARDDIWFDSVTTRTGGDKDLYEKMHFLRNNNRARALAEPGADDHHNRAKMTPLEQQYALLQNGLASISRDCWRNDPRLGMISISNFLDKNKWGQESPQWADAAMELISAATEYMSNGMARVGMAPVGMAPVGQERRPLSHQGWPLRKGGLHSAFVDVVANTLVQCAVRVALTSRDSFGVNKDVHPSVLVAMAQGRGLARAVLAESVSGMAAHTLGSSFKVLWTEPEFYQPQIRFLTGGPTDKDPTWKSAHVNKLRSCRAHDAPTPEKRDYKKSPFPSFQAYHDDCSDHHLPPVAHLPDGHELVTCVFRLLRLHRYVSIALVRHPVSSEGDFGAGGFWAPLSEATFGLYAPFESFERDVEASKESVAAVALFVDLMHAGYACLDDEQQEEEKKVAALHVAALHAMDRVLFKARTSTADQALRKVVMALEDSAERALLSGDRAQLWPAPDVDAPRYTAALLAIASTVNSCTLQVAQVANGPILAPPSARFWSNIIDVAFRFAEAHVEGLANSIRTTLKSSDLDEGDDEDDEDDLE